MKKRRRMEGGRRKRKGSRQETAAVLAGGSLFLLLLEIWKELHGFVIRRYRICLSRETAAREEVRLAFLSDLHGKTYGKGNWKLLSGILGEDPDYILVGGDMLTRSREASDTEALALLEKLVRICPVYMANGNHEQALRLNPQKYRDRYERYIKRAKDLGVHLLENGSEEVDMKGMPAVVGGVELPAECYGHFRTAKPRPQHIEQRIGKCRKDRFQILMAHNPVYMETCAGWGADLTLSGHLHGGLIHLPGIGDLITPQVRLFPKHSGGIYRIGDKLGIVSRGLGTHTVNIRLMNPAELVMITLQPGGKGFSSCTEEENQV